MDDFSKTSTEGMHVKDLTGNVLNQDKFNILLNEIKLGIAKGTFKSTNYIYFKDGDKLIKFNIKTLVAFRLSENGVWTKDENISKLLASDFSALPREYDVFEFFPIDDDSIKR